MRLAGSSLSSWIVSILLSTAMIASPSLLGQAPNVDPEKKKVDKNPIGATSTVKSNIAVEAGLLTSASATQLFGGWIAEHFLVVQVTIGNQSREQQFVLHDIFLDYSNWKLSGIYATSATDPSESTRPLEDFQSGTRRGQISSIGALEMQDSLKQNSIFSKRNFVVNGLVLIGSAAGGFTFLGPVGYTEGVAGYSSSFVPALQKFWPDRRIDQQSNLLKYGFQDKMVIAKEDPGKTYAFFPIERLLTKGLAQVYRSDPAVFLNMAELYLDPGAARNLRLRSQLNSLHKTVDRLILLQLKEPPLTCPSKGGTPEHPKSGEDCVESAELKARVLNDLFSPCYRGKQSPKNPDGEAACTLVPVESEPTQPVSVESSNQLTEIRTVKDIVAGLSLNTVRVVASGIMTVDVTLIPAVLTKIQFDDSVAGGKQIWEDTSSNHTGVIYGKYLANGKPVISGIKVPSHPNAKVDDYIVTNSPSTILDQSTDSELHFTLQFKKAIPPGSTLSFQVVKNSSKSINDPGNASTQETTTSMALDYSVSYTPSPDTSAKASITDTVFDSPADLLKAGQVTGHLAGSNLDADTIRLKSLKLVDGTAADPKTYVADGSAAKAPGSTGDTLNFTLSLKQGLPPGAEFVLEVTLKSAGGSPQTVDAKPYTVPMKK